MTGSSRTIKDAVRSFFGRTSIYFPPQDGDRLWFHDSVHALLGAGSTSRSEEMAGITQAVLLRSMDVFQTSGLLSDGGQDITLEDVKEHVLPNIQLFVNGLADRFNFRVVHHLSDEEIKTTYEKAKIVSMLFKNKFGMHMGEMPISDYLKIPIDDMQDLYDIADRLIRGSQIVFDSNTRRGPELSEAA